MKPMLVSIIVESAHHLYRATLTGSAEGVAVQIWNLDGRGGGPVMKSLKSSEIIDAPWHVALDRVHDLVQQLEDGQNWSGR